MNTLARAALLTLVLVARAPGQTPSETVAAAQSALVARAQAVSAVQSARAGTARDPASSARQAVDRAEGHIRAGNASMAAGKNQQAQSDFLMALQALRQATPALRDPTPTPTELAGFEADATIRRRQEEIDRRRLRQAEEMLHRVRTAALQSRSPSLHQRFERMQDNLIRVRQKLDTSGLSRFTGNLDQQLSGQVRPLLEETLQEGTVALAQFEAQKRSERDLEQTRGRVTLARRKLAKPTNMEVRGLLERADQHVRDSEAASARSDYIQARVSMGKAYVDTGLCYSYNDRSCGVCVRACPFERKALRAGLHEQPVVDPEYCVGCGLCERSCIRYPQAIVVIPDRERRP